MGSLAPVRPLGEDVAANARAAAFQDPRFPKLKREEWPYCPVEVSLLSAPKPIAFADEAELLSLIRAGEDGLILECNASPSLAQPATLAAGLRLDCLMPVMRYAAWCVRHEN